MTRMSHTTLAAWVLFAMSSIQPKAPWIDTYPKTADAIAKVSIDEPLFDGDDGPRRTAALFVSVAWFESTFNPKAEGDKGQSVCLFQIGVSNLKALGTTRQEILEDVEVCTRAARRMMKISFNVCRRRPFEEWLGHYASGGNTCGGLKESRHRVEKAKWIFAHFKESE